ncbi:MAG: pantoate--beta-alanine ligase, partial [Candidatus Omnitrophica bacterium]|nr:pantoate--beta-alanine ligase [Candidatus Omnitrophota bacterium]
IKVMPIVRERDGLAMSSRNIYLSPTERKEVLLYNSLKLAKDLHGKGERDAKKIIKKMSGLMRSQNHAKIDYISIVDIKRLKDVNRISGKVLVAVAAKVGKTRLIDNIIL